jgi:hypothetical protein
MNEFRSREQLWKDTYGNVLGKEAELAGTYDMPNTKPAMKDGDKKAVIVKTASAEESEDELLKIAFCLDLEVNEKAEPPPESPARHPQSTLRPHVDVSGKGPQRLTVKKAEHYALPYDEMYPLDGYDQVKMASAYFEEHGGQMPFNVRREYCQNMVKRANELGIATSEEAQRYASAKYAAGSDIDMAIDARRHSLISEDHIEILNKVAEQRSRMLPEQFAEVLVQFDKMANIAHLYGSYIPDPYLSTFGKEAAQESETAPDESIIIGNEYVTMRKLVEFSKLRQAVVASRFGEEFAREFTKDPKGIFDSLPRDQKLVLMRMANNSDSARQGASTS